MEKRDIHLKALAELVNEREAALACGEKSPILTKFESEYGQIQDALKSEQSVDQNVLVEYTEAYRSLGGFINQGLTERDFDGGYSEFEYSNQRQNEKRLDSKPNPMDPIFKKIDRYFGGYEVGVFNETGGKDGSGAVYKVDQEKKSIPYLKAMNARGRHIFVRPTYEREAHYMLHDDLDKKGLERHHKQNGKFRPGRMVVESSTGNYQVWVRTDRELTVEEKKYWLAKMDSDPGASPRHRWGRAPGFRNRKEKYENNGRYPLAKLVWVDWKGRAKVPVVELPKPEVEHTSKPFVPRANYGARPGSLPVRSDFERGNESKTDYAYMLALMRRGVSDSEVEKRIRDERTDWSHHKSDKAKEHYFEFSLPRARALVESTPSKPRQNARRDTGHNAEKKVSGQAYRIVAKNVEKNVKRSTVVEDLKEKEAKAVVEERARTMAVQLGFDKASDILVDVEPVKAQEPHKKKDLNLSLMQ